MKFLILLLLVSCASYTHLPNQKKLYDLKVLLEMNSIDSLGKSQLFQGTGVVVRSDNLMTLVLTNKHVCNDVIIPSPIVNNPEMQDFLAIYKYNPILVKKDGKKKTAFIVKVAENTDLCLLSVTDFKVQKSAQLSQAALEVGDQIFSVGDAGPNQDIFVSGFAGKIALMLQSVSMTVNQGQSGSGVFNKDGELVGLIADQTKESPGLGFMVPLSDIKLFLAGVIE